MSEEPQASTTTVRAATAESASSLRVRVRSIGLIGPGFPDWATSRDALASSSWTHAPTVVPPATRLPPAERRRAGDIVKLSLAVADQACQSASSVDTSDLATVFSASTGDAKNCHALCEALALPDRSVSPTRFTNSVHNASGGYWHIACKSQAPSTSLCALDGSFSAGLLEAAVQCVTLQRPVLLVVADVPYPEPLHGVRPISETMAIALLLDLHSHSQDDGNSHRAGHGAGHGDDADPASITLAFSNQPPTCCDDRALEKLRLAAPTGRALPLLAALASLISMGRATTVVLDYPGGPSLEVAVMSPTPGSAA